MKAIGNYFCLNGESFGHQKEITDIIVSADQFIAGVTEETTLKKEYLEIMGRLPDIPHIEDKLKAILVLSQVGEPVVDPIFSKTDAIGTVMRKKLEPVAAPLRDQFAILKN